VFGKTTTAAQAEGGAGGARGHGLAKGMNSACLNGQATLHYRIKIVAHWQQIKWCPLFG